MLFRLTYLIIILIVITSVVFFIHTHTCISAIQACPVNACLYLICLGDAEGSSSGVAQLIQCTQAHRKILTGIHKHLNSRGYALYKTTFTNSKLQHL